MIADPSVEDGWFKISYQSDAVEVPNNPLSMLDHMVHASKSSQKDVVLYWVLFSSI